jgi:hypothetical protein
MRVAQRSTLPRPLLIYTGELQKLLKIGAERASRSLKFVDLLVLPIESCDETQRASMLLYVAAKRKLTTLIACYNEVRELAVRLKHLNPTMRLFGHFAMGLTEDKSFDVLFRAARKFKNDLYVVASLAV